MGSFLAAFWLLLRGNLTIPVKRLGNLSAFFGEIIGYISATRPLLHIRPPRGPHGGNRPLITVDTVGGRHVVAWGEAAIGLTVGSGDVGHGNLMIWSDEASIAQSLHNVNL